ncbi:MAG: hydroxyacylglutathione hydrolase family protein, partial [Pseudomonadota bacterium]
MPVEIVTVPCRRDNYAYLVRDTASGTVALVDAPEAAPIERALSERGWSLDQIWITHHHDDHTAAVPALRAGARVIGNTEDRARLPELDTELAEGDSFAFGGTTVGIADVSGHTIGHIAFLIDGDGAEPGAAFTADSLMALGCGRVFEGTMPMMCVALQARGAAGRDADLFRAQLRRGERAFRAVGRAGERGASGARGSDCGGGQGGPADRAGTPRR